jgi:hypothetical protein
MATFFINNLKKFSILESLFVVFQVFNSNKTLEKFSKMKIFSFFKKVCIPKIGIIKLAGDDNKTSA